MKSIKVTMRVLPLIALVSMLASCGKERSGATGWSYNDKESGGYQRMPYLEQETGPGLVLVEGGRFTMGRVEDDVMYSWDNIPRTVTVSSFYMDETEVTNQYWLDYLHWLGLVYGESYPELVNRALPDTLVWREKMSFMDPYVEYYLRHPAYQDYPVVGVSWLQANDFCAWRTDRVNEIILIREGLFIHSPTAQLDEEHFNTDSYLAGQYEPAEKAADGILDMNPKSSTGYRNVRMEDGILLPRYRLPTEAEWEYAAWGMIGNSFQELITERKYYPWNGHYVRNDDNGGKFFGTIRANFVRGQGDYMGVAGYLNDNADVTAPVFAYPPNDYGLYNMAGNVSEWVMDVYRPLSPEDKNEFRPYRGNVYETKVMNGDGSIADKYDYNKYDLDGVAYFLKEYTSRTEGKLTEADITLLETCQNLLEQAREKVKERQIDEAMTEYMQAMMDEITESESPIAPDLRDGIADYIIAAPGGVKMRDVTAEENIDRRNYRIADNMDYRDGDFQSSIFYYDPSFETDANRMYEWGTTTLINNRARVYKGGSWGDRAYFTVPGTRRYLDERRSSAMIGFRCAMTRVGSPVGLGGVQ
ncbi:MAG: SUMF1/EgtB/PvdO family nonheme iron enzyme [Flavobacteriales bacterium]|nr:SUMF1/EgtB/PvdO family nonheme iron enzyme [Flavobacteriales bacterium]